MSLNLNSILLSYLSTCEVFKGTEATNNLDEARKSSISISVQLDAYFGTYQFLSPGLYHHYPSVSLTLNHPHGRWPAELMQKSKTVCRYSGQIKWFVADPEEKSLPHSSSLLGFFIASYCCTKY